MVLVDWTEDQGWHDPRVVPYGPFSMDPATMVLHYAQEIFEGLKVYRQPDGGVATFRPQANADRLNKLGRPTRHAPADRGPVRRVDPRVGPRRPGLGAVRRRGVAVPAAVHVRCRGRAGCPPGQPLRLRGHRLAGRRLLPARRAAGQRLVVDRVRPGGSRRHRCRQDRRELRRVARRPGAGRREGLRPGRLARRGGAPLGRGDGRDEPVLRLRLAGVRPRRGGHP